MSTLTIDLDDDSTRLVQEAARSVNKPVREWARNSICQAAARAMAAPTPARRISPLHPGAIQPAGDFNGPLEEFTPYV